MSFNLKNIHWGSLLKRAFKQSVSTTHHLSTKPLPTDLYNCMSVVMIFVHVKIEKLYTIQATCQVTRLHSDTNTKFKYWMWILKMQFNPSMYCNFTNLKIINHQQVQVSRRVDAKACLLNPTGCCSNGKSLLFSTFPNVLSLFDHPIWAIFHSGILGA